MSLRGNDIVIIDDGGSGSTTGASKTNTANWKNKREPKTVSKPAKQATPTVSYNLPAPTPIQERAAFDLKENPSAVLKPAAGRPFRNPLALGGPNPNAAMHLDGNQTLSNRIKNTVLGGVKRSIASDVNSTANAYDLTQGARNSMMNDYLADYEHGLSRAQNDLRQMEESGASAWDAEQQRMIVNDWQRKVDAMREAIAAQPKATRATYGLADDIKANADASIETAKRGLNQLGQLVVDTGAKLTQMGTDAAKSWYLLNQFNVNSGAEDFVKRLPLAGRIYGENTQTARHEGADAGNAAFYGATSAIADTKIKKQFDGLNKFYGKAWADDAAEYFARKINSSSALQHIAKAGFNDLGEGVLESIATDLANQILKSTYNGKDSIQNGTETEWGRVGRNVLIDTIIAVLSGDSGMASD